MECANSTRTYTGIMHSNLSIKNQIEYKDINYYPSKYSNQKFEKKVESFKSYILTLKISFLEGCERISATRENILQTSMKRSKEINMYKELKIDFIGEDPNDAGGIMREWFMIIIEKLESKEMGIFQKNDNDDISFIPRWDLENNQQNKEYFKFIGFLIAKALLENITINLCFNKAIYKLIINEPISIDDLKVIDRQLYLSINDLKKYDKETLSSFCLYYVFEYKNKNDQLIIDELQPNGSNIPIVDVEDYAMKRIQYMIDKYKPFVDCIKETLFTVYYNNIIKVYR